MLLEELQALAPNTRLYPASLQRVGGETYIWAQDGHQHYLLIAHDPALPPFGRDTFGGEVQDFDAHTALKWCLPSHSNARKMRRFFTWTAPRVLRAQATFGVGDPLGLAGAAHIRAARECNIEAALVLAQFWPGEAEYLGRSAEDVLDATTWAAFQENYREPWGAEAEVQTADEAKRLAAVGFTSFTTIEASAEAGIIRALEAAKPEGYDWWVEKDDEPHKRHVRTWAWAAWQPMIRTIALTEPALFREICTFVRDRVTLNESLVRDASPEDLPRLSIGEGSVRDVSREVLPDVARWPDGELPKLLDIKTAHQVLQMVFDLLLQIKDERGAWLFRPHIYRALLDHEDVHFACIIEDDRRVFESLGWT